MCEKIWRVCAAFTRRPCYEGGIRVALLDQQRAVLRLLTEPALARQFFADPPRLAWQLGLSEEDCGVVSQLEVPEFRLYQRMIQSKWITAVARDQLRWTLEVAGPMVTEMAMVLVERHPMARNEWQDRILDLQDLVLNQLDREDPRTDYVRYERALNSLWAMRRAGISEEHTVAIDSSQYRLSGLFAPISLRMTADAVVANVEDAWDGVVRHFVLHLPPVEREIVCYEVDEGACAWMTVAATADQVEACPSAEAWAGFVDCGLIQPAYREV